MRCEQLHPAFVCAPSAREVAVVEIRISVAGRSEVFCVSVLHPMTDRVAGQEPAITCQLNKQHSSAHSEPTVLPLNIMQQGCPHRLSCTSCGRPRLGFSAPMACLIVVAALWASYGVAMRLIYAEPGAASASVLTALKATITAISLLLGVKWSKLKNVDEYVGADLCPDESLQLTPVLNSPVHVETVQPRALLSFLLHPTRSIVSASIEIGLYAGIGALFHAWGLSQTPAITSAFLIQTTTIITPCICFFAGEHITTRVWIATAGAALGTVLIFCDSIEQAEAHTVAPVNQASILGMLAVLTAAAFYSMGTMRISQVASGFHATNLAAGQSVVRAAIAIAAASPEIACAIHRSTSATAWLADLWPNWQSPRAIALVTWTALGPGSLAFVLQMYAQRAVSATSAQVVYASTPIWAAAYALMILSEKAFDAWGWAGAACIVAASLGVLRFPQRQSHS
eukprot:jgi/Ulvmu1/6461/UM003_0092.1